MPELCRFLGIVITMYHKDHAPPHFHARYGDYKAAIAIDGLAVIEGKLPARILGIVVEWASMHKKELQEDWVLCQKELKPNKIDPLI